MTRTVGGDPTLAGSWHILSRPLILFLLLTAPRAFAGGASDTLVPGDSTHSIRHASYPSGETLTRPYDLHVPPSYDGLLPVPLVFDLHANGATEKHQASISGFIEKADEEGFIVVHPQGFENSWNSGDQACGTAQSSALDDVGFLRSVVEDISSMANIDPSRVYSTGQSCGGGMSHRLACDAADVFAAVAPVARPLSLIPLSKCQPSRPISVRHFHARDDNCVLYDGGVSPGCPFGSVPVQESFAYWAEVNGCVGSPTPLPCETYTECLDDVQVSLCTTEDGGHHFYDNSTLDVADVAWDFMRQFTLPSESQALPPAAPTDLSAMALSSTEIRLGWIDASDDEDDFEVQARRGEARFQTIQIALADSTGATVSDLATETTYRFRIRARSSAGNSAWSNRATATTLTIPPPPLTEPCFRDNLTACLLGDSVARGSGPGDGRFEVTVDMRDFGNPPSGPGGLFPGMIQFYNGASSETSQAVNFYSFEFGNVEIFVKMVDACSSGFNSFWVFAAGATNAETVILIRDTWMGQVYRIDNPRGQDFFFPPDTQAFKTCSASPP